MLTKKELQAMEEHAYQHTLKTHELCELMATYKTDLELATALYTLGYIRASKEKAKA